MAEMKCNNCGAPFANVTEKTEVTCAFCGTKQTLQPEVRRKYTAKLAGKTVNEPISTPVPQTIAPELPSDTSKSQTIAPELNSDTPKSQTIAPEPRLKASESRTKTLHEYFLGACEYYGILDMFDDKIAEAKESVRQYNKTRKMKIRQSRTSSTLSNFIISGIIVATSVVIASTSQTEPGLYFAGGLIFPGSLIACLVNTHVIQKNKNAEKVKEAEAEWEANHKGELESLNKECDILLQEKEDFIYENYKVIDFLPPDYREPYHVYYMESLVRNGRAESLKETINLFEELMHRERLEANSAQMLEQTERMQRQLAQWRIENNVHSIINHAQMSALNRNVRDIYDKLDQ